MTTTASPSLTDTARMLLCKRYLAHGPEYPLCPECQRNDIPGHTCEGRHETIDQFFDRISMGNPEYREMLTSLDFLPNSPTLFNIGLGDQTMLSACFKFNVPDSMDGIFDVVKRAGMVIKHGGGVGFTVSALRPQGALVNSTHGVALGPVNALAIFQETASRMTQGGKRDAAQMGILHCDHPDIERFIHMKDEEPQRYATFNISVALTDDFMSRATTDAGSREARLLREMAESAWRTGDPGVFFIDVAERGNPTPWLGAVDGTNPCGEVPLRNNEACNLGSLNLGHFVGGSLAEPKVEWRRLKERVKLATRYLDDVLDHNWFPDPLITAAVAETRKLGLGVTGWADMLALMRIRYASDEAVELAEKLSKFIAIEAYEESLRLAAEKGHAPAYDHPDASFNINAMPRNTTRTCIAPTGSIGQLMGAQSLGIEPHFAIENSRMMGDGTTYMERVDFGGWLPQTAMGDGGSEVVPWGWHIRHQAAWQKHTDLAVSKTINMPNNATPDDVLMAYVEMWNSGCKGGTIYRDGSRDVQVLTSTSSLSRAAEPHIDLGHLRRPLPDEAQSLRRKVRIGDETLYLHIGLYEDGKPGELFINANKQGSTVAGMYDALGRLASHFLQLGGSPDELAEALRGMRFEPSGFTTDRDIPNVSSPVDYLAQLFSKRWGSEASASLPVLMGMFCPDCSGRILAMEGCMKCENPVCGWSRC